MDEEIVLDRKSFEALALESRVKILKSLKERRKTLSELAEEQKMSVSGVKEHLGTLEKVGLIKKIDDGHKWKYYELTKKGREIIGPKEIRVWILLIISMLALAVSLNSILPYQMQEPSFPKTNEAELLSAGFDNNTQETTMALAYEDQREEIKATGQDNLPAVIITIISALCLIGCIAILVKNRLMK